jgi:hypothetical protein
MTSRMPRRGSPIGRSIHKLMADRAYRGRDLIERMRCRLKDFRRIATRYDRADIFLNVGLPLLKPFCHFACGHHSARPW